MSKKLWVIVLAVWFIAWGLISITNVRFDSQNLLMGLLALAGGVLLAFDK